MARTATTAKPARPSQKVGLLRVFRATAAVARYCARNAGRLFLLVWFPCLLAVLCQLVLDFLTLAFPPRLPDWLLAGAFNPPTWLTAVAQTPWGAMMWTFVLADMSDRNTRRGLIRSRVLRPLQPRFALSIAILVAAVLFSAVNLLDGGLRMLQLPLLAAIYASFEPSEELLGAFARTGQVVQVIVMAAVVAASYLAIGQLLRTGFKGMAGVWGLTRHNRLRVFALFLLLSVAGIALDAATAPATGWLLRNFADELFWTFKTALIRQLVDLPFFMLWTVVYAVTVGVVLGALEQRAAAQAPAPPPPLPRPKAAAAPPPRPGGSRPW
jgi:hypothetical protein